MIRDLDALADRRFDVAIIGGGVVGACLARDAARRGLSVALVEVEDFAAAASEAMSHFIHGGIRYLAQGRIGLVRESLRERAVWRMVAPHLVEEISFLFPLSRRQGLRHRVELGVGAILFEAMSGRGFGRRLGRRELIDAEPALDDKDIFGGLVYGDCRVDFPERAVLALLADAADLGAAVANHVEAVGLVVTAGRAVGVEAVDSFGCGRFVIRARSVVNAAGSWAGGVADRLAPGQRSVALTLSKGVHLVTAPLARRHAFGFSGGGEHAFVSPWRGWNIVGTTDVPFSGGSDPATATPAETEMLAEKVAGHLPGARALLDGAISSFAAVRAIPGAGRDTYRAARDALFADHAADGSPGFFTLTGGKWTTARAMAELALDRIVAVAGMAARPCDTATAPLGVAPLDEAGFRARWLERLSSFPADEADEWISCYGNDVGRVVDRIAPGGEGDPDAREAARFAEALDHEMALTADDLARRMTRARALARPGLRFRAGRWLAKHSKGAQVSPGQDGGGRAP